MCGRFTLTLDPDELREAFDLSSIPAQWVPRYNIAPSQPLAVILDAEKRTLDYLTWGLVPSWAKDAAIGQKLINARSETITEKPSFRTAFSRRRCLIPADGFFEWTKPDHSQKIPALPHYFRRRGGKPFAFAGLWELWRSPKGEELKTCTILTTAANPLVARVHERMPVIFDPAESFNWLQPLPAPDLLAMLRAFPAEDMEALPVNRAVNDPRRDDPLCIQPLK
ncbi:MAG: SOS response-associated peptidase [Bellilinea sp.]|jgi:putative SOS response-associated peptidase YedK